MRIVFWGTPDFTLPALEAILNSSHHLAAVVTVPDKQQGRGLKVTCSPVKQFAIKHNIPVLQPESLKDPELTSRLNEYDPDIFVVVAFKILPPQIFNLPKFGSFNLHASLLPKYRGAAPIQWALINGETETGVTSFKLDQKVDTGSIYLIEKIAIAPDDNFEALHDKLSELGAKVIVKTLDLISTGNAIMYQQNNELATPAPKITKETCLINWVNPAERVRNLIRGLSPVPGAYFSHKGNFYKVFSAEEAHLSGLLPGEIKTTKTEIFVGCGSGSIKITDIQKEGRKRMSAEEFLRGYSF